MASIDGVPFFAFGTPGGDQQDQWSLNFLLAYLHGGRNIQQAIDAPMFHTSHFRVRSIRAVPSPVTSWWKTGSTRR